MNASIQRFFLLTIGLLFCVLGCTRDRGHTLIPDHISHPTEVMTSTADIEVSFEQDLLPILTTRCALAGCHVADGPHGLDFRTYESFVAGGEHGPAFVPGNAQESAVIEEIVSGRMPPGGPPLTDAEIQVFVDWINQQEAQEGGIQQEHGEHEDDEDAHEEMEVEHEDDDEHDEDIDDGHDDMDDVHDEEEDEHDEDDEHDDEDDDDNGHDDN